MKLDILLRQRHSYGSRLLHPVTFSRGVHRLFCWLRLKSDDFVGAFGIRTYDVDRLHAEALLSPQASPTPAQERSIFS